MELLRDRSREFEDAGVRAVGVSRDSPWTHLAWSQALDLNFSLLSDFNGDATRAFGVAHEFRGLRDVSRRSAFLLGTDGSVLGSWRYESSEVPSFDALLEVARTSASSS
jgi:glutaredoxin-dependent peroxiredoxin